MPDHRYEQAGTITSFQWFLKPQHRIQENPLLLHDFDYSMSGQI